MRKESGWILLVAATANVSDNLILKGTVKSLDK